jgi:hypothetical protein
MQIDCCINLLNSPAPEDREQQLENMVRWCRKWDDVYGYDAMTIYPELGEWFKKYGY